MQSDLALLHQVSASAGLPRTSNDQGTIGVGRNDVASELAELQRLRAEKAAQQREREGRRKVLREGRFKIEKGVDVYFMISIVKNF